MKPVPYEVLAWRLDDNIEEDCSKPYSSMTAIIIFALMS